MSTSLGRTVISFAAGLVIGPVVGALTSPELAPMAGWVAGATLLTVWTWRRSWPKDAAGTEKLAEEIDRFRGTADAIVLTAAVVSLGAVAIGLVRSSSAEPAVRYALVLLSLGSVVVSWTLVHTVFAMMYARLYYRDETAGLAFPEDHPPRYSDFAYLAFTVGMAYSGPEPEPRSSTVRKVVLAHAILSYLFGTGVLAVAINLVTNLGQS